VAIITGAGRGIGRATALEFAKRGTKLALLSRTEAELEDVEREIHRISGRNDDALRFVVDVSEEPAIVKTFAEVENRFGRLDILVNNAATFIRAPLTEISGDDWDHVMAVNLRGSFLCAREAFGRMKKGGCIVNVSSLAGIRGTEKFEGLSAYVASKFGVVGLTESLAVEGKSRGIRVNCVAPGAVNTIMLKQAAPHLQTNTQPEEIAKIIVNLCDDAHSGSANGSVIEIHSNLNTVEAV